MNITRFGRAPVLTCWPAPAGDRLRPWGHLGLMLGLLALILGLAQMAYSSFQALSSGRRADVQRHWVVSHYFLHGQNPYEISAEVLERTFGPIHSCRLSENRIYKIPSFSEKTRAAQPHWAQVLGPPEATYPPSSVLLLTLLIGWLPQLAVHSCWLFFNYFALLACVVLLAERYQFASKAVWVPLAIVAGFLLLWPPTQRVVATSQFSLLVFVCLLLSWRSLENNQLQAGFWLSLVLIKPSIGLPFLILPLVRGRWVCLAVVGAVHGSLTLLAAWWLETPPLLLLTQWLRVAGYFTQGMYTLQDLLNRVGWENTPQGLAVVAAFLLAAGGWCWWHREEGQPPLVEMLCFVSLFWTYHGTYDFVLLIPPLLGLVDTARREPRFRGLHWGWGAFCFGVGSLALWPLVYASDDSQVCQALRWTWRIVLLCWFVGVLFQRRRIVPQNAESTAVPDAISLSNLRASA